MSVNTEPNTLKTDITDFIQLLQKQSSNRRRLSLDSDKLSIIYSASQPQSSSLISNKQNSHQSANTNTHDVPDHDEFDNLVKEIIKIGVNGQQNRMLGKLSNMCAGLRKAHGALEVRCKALQMQFQQQKAGTDEILKALVKMDEAQKQLWSTYNQLSQRYQKLQQKYKTLKQQNKELQFELSQNHKDIQFMRKLVLVANQNYENLQRKCNNLQRNMSIVETFKQQRSSPQIVSRSTIVNGKKKSSCSPSISDRSNMSAKGGSFQDNYRKLVLRTLKSKAIR